LSLNGFYANRSNRVAKVWNILEITPDLAHQRMVLRGDHVVSIHGRPIVEYTNEEVEALMQSNLNGAFAMMRKAARNPRQRSRIMNTGVRITAANIASVEDSEVVQAMRCPRSNHLTVTSLPTNPLPSTLRVGDVIISVDSIPAADMRPADANVRFAIPRHQVTISQDKANRIRLRLQSFVTVAQQWDYESPCRHCGYIFLQSRRIDSRNICCLKGRAHDSTYFPPLWPLPPYIRFLATDRLEHMGGRSSYYNAVLALGATAVDNGKGGGWEKIRGNHAVKLNGRTYHFIPKTGAHCQGGIQYFTYDAASQMEAYTESLNTPNGQHGERTVREYVKGIYEELKEVNELVNECEQIGIMAGNEVLSEGDARALKLAINVKTSAFDVAAITSDATTGERVLKYKLKGERCAKTIPSTHRLLEPLSYPLLFPYGESGWSAMNRTTLEYHPYLCSRMLMPERDFDDNILTVRNKQNTRDWPINRFQLMSRLGQIYLTDMLSRGIDFRLHWHKHHRNYIFGGSNHSATTEGEEEGRADNMGSDNNGAEEIDQNDDDSGVHDDDENEDIASSGGTNTFLAQSFHGSRRHLRKLATSSLTIVSEDGTPTLFLTMTCNPLWPEIVEALLPGQTAFDRPDICTQVFKHRLEAFLGNLRAGKYFDSEDEFKDCTIRRKIIYEIRVIEYQHRGLPHAHIIIKLSNTPDPMLPDVCSEWVDEFLTCIMPIITDDSTEEDKVYAAIVSKHLVHNCSEGVNGCKDGNGHCKKGFMNTVICERTTFDGRGHAKYKRLKEEDLRVVPHNRKAAIDWDGHIYFDWCMNSYTVFYLYKYLFKGSKKVKFRLENADDVDDSDEITLYLRGRYLCSMDAMWRVLGYHTYPSPTPKVRTIKAMLPEVSSTFRRKQKLSDLEMYFARPSELHHFKYVDFNKEYIAYYKLPVTCARDPTSYYTVQLPDQERPLYICKRLNRIRTIVRMEMLYPSAGEVWYLRQLLLHKSFTSYRDAKIFQGEAFRSFQQSALAHGIVTEEKEALLCFRESMLTSTPSELRFLFAILTIEGFPTHPIFYDEVCFDAMTDDYKHDATVIQTSEGVFNTLLKDLVYMFAERGANLTDYAFPEPLEYNTELERETLKFPCEEQAAVLQQLMADCPNNEEQEELYQTIIDAIDNLAYCFSPKFFIQGQGGCGKTTLARKIMAYARSKGNVALGCASTALAATNYDDFSTAHSLFCFPVFEEDEIDPSEPPQCNFHSNPERLELLCAAKVIIWDEMLCNHKQLYEAAYRETDCFKGKVLICMGDWRQIMPIVKHGVRQEVVQACIKSSYLWGEFTVLKLTINMRLRGLHADLMRRVDENGPRYLYSQEYQEKKTALDKQTSYGKMILTIGEGRANHDDLDMLNRNDYDATQIYRLPTIPYHLDTDEGMKEALSWLYPDGFNSSTMYNSCILAARNDRGDRWNEIVQDMNPNEKVLYKSKDVLCEVDDPHGRLQRMLTTAVLNDCNNNGVPPHLLHLKKGDICLVLRNLSKRHGLVTNKRVRILELMSNSIKVQTLDSNPKVAIIPRIRFKFRLSLGDSFEMMRTQFPLRLAYCMSYNKSQGQTLQRVLLDITTPPFAHGHLYVALSRVTLYSDVHIICENSQLFDEMPFATNTTYPELLDLHEDATIHNEDV
jgi:hypothetical protein